MLEGRLSLKERVMILLVAASLPLAALSVWFSVREMRSATELAGSQLRFAASLIAAHQDRTVEAAQHLLGAISAMPMMRTPERKTCENYFEAMRGIYPIYANMGILNTKGQVVCHAKGRAADFNAADRSYFQRALAERRFVMGEPLIGRATGRFSLPFAQPVFDGERVAAIAFAVLDLEHAGEALAGTELPAGAQVIVADRRGTVLMEHPPHTAGVPGSKLAEGLLLDAARRMSAGTGEWDDAAGEPRIHAYVPSRVVGGEGFLAEVSIDRDQVQHAFLVTLRDQLLVLGITLLVGFAVAWWVGGRVIVGPAKQILATVRRLEQGLLDARVPLRPGRQRGEFARIGAAFNLMADSLQLRQRDLESELGRSRGAYLVLDLVLNSMQESLVAVTGTGQFLMFNEAASRLFPLGGAGLLPQQWAQRFGFYHEDKTTLYRTEDLPLVRSARGESGRQQLLFVRNALVPEGRLLQCSWQPIRSEGGVSGGLVVFTDVTELERLQAEQAAQFAELRETQRKLIEAQRIGRTGNFELDLATGRLWWSDEVYKLFGVDKERFDGSLDAFLERVHPDDRALPKRARDAALRDGRVVSTEFRIVKSGGEVAWMHEIAEVRRDEQGQPVWFGGVVQDITGRRRDEEALLRSERELHAYTLTLQRAAAAAQAITAKPTIEDTLRQVVEQARLVIGARMAMVSLTPDGDRCHGHSALSLAGAHQEWHGLEPGAESSVCESGQPLRLTQAQLEAPNGPGSEHAVRRSPVNGLLAVPLAGRDGASIGLLQIADKELGDFSERDEYVAMELAHLASIAIENARLFTQIRELNAGLEARIAERTAELARQEQLFRTLAEQAPAVVWNTDTQGRATFLNRAWYDLVGGESADGLGQGWMKRLHPDDVRDVQRNWNNSRQTQQPYSGIRRFLAQDGSYHTMSYKAAPVLDEHGGVVFWIGVDADITELKAIEQALRSSNQELEAFSYSVSHDLRAPLGAVTGFSSALALKLVGHPDERVAHYLARIQAAVGKMEQLIEALLSLARVARAPLHYARVDLGALARESLETLQLQEPQRNVTVQVEEGLVAHGDNGLLRAVMENLLGNAWKFTSQREEGRIEVGRVGSGVFCVRDNGVGFDMAYATRLFGAFQRLHTEAEFPGTGIGLATVRRIVARHQGRVWAESRVGEGATFFFTLSEVAPPAWLAPEKS
jgi:PAS domain S-box-containing protein